MLRRWIRSLLVAFLAVFFWVYSRTWKVRHLNFPSNDAVRSPLIYAHWHGDELLLIGAYSRSRMAVMASLSRDGELQTKFLTWLGYKVVRGSSSRGGAAGLRALVDAVNLDHFNASLAVDGPRGPIYEAKPGILKLAEKTGCLLVPGAAAASRRYVFQKAWNRAFFPMPFARCVIVYGEPISVPEGASADELEVLRKRLEQALLSLKVRAESEFGRDASAILTKLAPSGV